MIIFFAANALFAEEKIRLASGEWIPYQSKSAKYNGVASRIVSEAFSLVGVTVKYDYFPWARSLKNAELGLYDGTFLWFNTPERRKVFYISEPILDIQYVFFHRKDYAFNWKTMSDLQGKHIGGTIMYDYGEAFQSAENKKIIKVDRVGSDELNFRKLLAGRIDLFPNDLDAGFELMHQHLTPEESALLTYHTLPLKAAPHHLLLSKKITKNKWLIQRFNKGLQQLKKSGKIEKYLAESRKGVYRND